MTSGTAPGSTGGPPADSAAELDALHAAALALSGELDPEAVLELIVDHAAGLVAGSFGYLYMVDESEQLLVERIGQGPFVRFVGTTIGRDVGVAGRVWRTGKPQIENHYRNWSDRRMTLGDAVPAAVLGVPLVSSGRVVGVIGLSHMDEGSAFTAADEALVSRFAQLASLAVERSELTAELRSELAERRRTEEELHDTVSRLSGSETALRRTQDEMVRRLSAAAEHRDRAIGRHIERVALYCDLIARRLGLDETFAELIRIASPLHDIGKIGIPDHVLLKPGPLDDGERSLIEQHAEIGYRILTGSGTELLDLAASIALTHHERWDGAGYPMRLRAEEIPLEGRIVAVADVFDALTSDRVYRAAFSPDSAVEIMVAGRGTQFDQPSSTPSWISVRTPSGQMRTCARTSLLAGQTRAWRCRPASRRSRSSRRRTTQSCPRPHSPARPMRPNASSTVSATAVKPSSARSEFSARKPETVSSPASTSSSTTGSGASPTSGITRFGTASTSDRASSAGR